MFKHYFEQMEGIASYPVFSMLVFVLFFLGVIFWAIMAKKSHLEHMSSLPLSNDLGDGPAIISSTKNTHIDLTA